MGPGKPPDRRTLRRTRMCSTLAAQPNGRVQHAYQQVPKVPEPARDRHLRSVAGGPHPLIIASWNGQLRAALPAIAQARLAGGKVEVYPLPGDW
jgi:hypothetical protein